MTSPDTADLAGKGGLILDAQGASLSLIHI